ncbi:hypothetical protein J2S01_001860 [Pectinatus haikarae]|uniref:Uncharacterized protein n=1 Tax=Pectinatus haikarae TaxID=349096 RepID=A0ABT9Y9G7_9FIRM|nr:hypothetical protein [Pectinatus haikarae]
MLRFKYLFAQGTENLSFIILEYLRDSLCKAVPKM